MIADFHAVWGWVAVALCGAAGLWGILLAVLKRRPGRAFAYGAGIAIAAVLIQVGAGLVLLGQGFSPGGFHVFYGMVILFTFSFAYVYRAQLGRRPALSWGLLLLFVMGLGIRAITTFGGS